MSQFNTVKQRYGFQEVRIANWRDPRESVHPARGGPSPTAMIAGNIAGTPFVPYKVKYRARPVVPPEPSEEEGDGSVDDNGDGDKSETETQATSEVRQEEPAAAIEMVDKEQPEAEDEADVPEHSMADPALDDQSPSLGHPADEESPESKTTEDIAAMAEEVGQEVKAGIVDDETAIESVAQDSGAEGLEGGKPADGDGVPVEGDDLPAEGDDLPAEGYDVPAEGREVLVVRDEVPTDGDKEPADGGDEGPPIVETSVDLEPLDAPNEASLPESIEVNVADHVSLAPDDLDAPVGLEEPEGIDLPPEDAAEPHVPEVTLPESSANPITIVETPDIGLEDSELLEKKVQFAPGTPDGRHRKKKSSKGSKKGSGSSSASKKDKKKKVISSPVEVVDAVGPPATGPDDIIAIVEGPDDIVAIMEGEEASPTSTAEFAVVDGSAGAEVPGSSVATESEPHDNTDQSDLLPSHAPEPDSTETIGSVSDPPSTGTVEIIEVPVSPRAPVAIGKSEKKKKDKDKEEKKRKSSSVAAKGTKFKAGEIPALPAGLGIAHVGEDLHVSEVAPTVTEVLKAPPEEVKSLSVQVDDAAVSSPESSEAQEAAVEPQVVDEVPCEEEGGVPNHDLVAESDTGTASEATEVEDEAPPESKTPQNGEVPSIETDAADHDVEPKAEADDDPIERAQQDLQADEEAVDTPIEVQQESTCGEAESVTEKEADLAVPDSAIVMEDISCQSHADDPETEESALSDNTDQQDDDELLDAHFDTTDDIILVVETSALSDASGETDAVSEPGLEEFPSPPQESPADEQSVVPASAAPQRIGDVKSAADGAQSQAEPGSVEKAIVEHADESVNDNPAIGLVLADAQIEVGDAEASTVSMVKEATLADDIAEEIAIVEDDVQKEEALEAIPVLSTAMEDAMPVDVPGPAEPPTEPEIVEEPPTDPLTEMTPAEACVDANAEQLSEAVLEATVLAENDGNAEAVAAEPMATTPTADSTDISPSAPEEVVAEEPPAETASPSVEAGDKTELESSTSPPEDPPPEPLIPPPVMAAEYVPLPRTISHKSSSKSKAHHKKISSTNPKVLKAEPPPSPTSTKRHSSSSTKTSHRTSTSLKDFASSARLLAQERKLMEEEELRRIRYEVKRAARKAAAEEIERLAREEAERNAEEERERRRRRRERARMRQEDEEKEKEKIRRKERERSDFKEQVKHRDRADLALTKRSLSFFGLGGSSSSRPQVSSVSRKDDTSPSLDRPRSSRPDSGGQSRLRADQDPHSSRHSSDNSTHHHHRRRRRSSLLKEEHDAFPQERGDFPPSSSPPPPIEEEVVVVEKSTGDNDDMLPNGEGISQREESGSRKKKHRHSHHSQERRSRHAASKDRNEGEEREERKQRRTKVKDPVAKKGGGLFGLLLGRS